MYYILNNKKVVNLAGDVDFSGLVRLTDGQSILYENYPYVSIPTIKNYKGDGSDIDTYMHSEPVKPTIDELREEAKNKLNRYSRSTLTKVVDVLGLCESLVSSRCSSDRGIPSILSEDEILKNSDNFLLIGKLCKQKLEESISLIDSAIDEDSINNIVSSAINDFDSYINDNDTLESHKISKLREVELYDTSDNINGFFLNGNLMWLDKSTRSGLVNTLNSATLVDRDTINIWYNSIYITLPVEQAKQLLASLEIYATDCYNVTAQHKVNINNLTTIEEVDSYDITKGYPDRLEFTI